MRTREPEATIVSNALSYVEEWKSVRNARGPAGYDKRMYDTGMGEDLGGHSVAMSEPCEYP